MKRMNPTKGGDTHDPTDAYYALLDIVKRGHQIRRNLAK